MARSRQITFYANEADQQELLDLAYRKSCFKRYESWQRPTELFQNCLFDANARPGFLSYFLARDADHDAVAFHEVPGKDYVVADVIRSPVIEHGPSIIAGDTMHPGRFYLVSSYFNKFGAIEWKDGDFLKTAEACFRAARKLLIKHDSVYRMGRTTAPLTDPGSSRQAGR